MDEGFSFCGSYHSKKQEIELRRIEVTASGEVYQVRPSFLMPYMIARTEEIEKTLYLRQWEVPFDALAYVFGRAAMFWYSSARIRLGQSSLVSTTVKDREAFPQDLVVDEKHTWRQGEKVYLATTVAQACFLGASLAQSAGTEELQTAYGEFAVEARHLQPDYQPKTVCTDRCEGHRTRLAHLFEPILAVHTLLLDPSSR